jgi:HlyD family type I secretion membrane fusion protein
MRLPQIKMPGFADVPAALPTIEAGWSATDPWIGYGKKLMWALAALAVACSFISISGAVVASGTVSVESQYKTVQHLDGGIVAKILVKNGDTVKQGDVLIRLDDTQVRANLGVVKGRMTDALIQLARLEAERDDKAKFALPDAIANDLSDPQVARMLEAQHTLFAARRLTKLGEQSVLRQRIEQISNDLAGAEHQLTARMREFDFTSRELKNVMPLFEKGFVNQQRIGPLQRDTARLEGDIGRLTGDLAKAKSALAEAKLKLAQSDKEFQSNVAEELRKVQASIGELVENRNGLEDKLSRTLVRAPHKGRVHALAPTTEGGVITAASAIAQVIPEGEKLIVEVRIQPTDVDKVRGGLAAAVKFPAFNAQRTPRLEGIVTTVSPAQIADNSPAAQGKPYFTAQIELPADELAKLGKESTLVPGMPAEVFIETTPRSVLSYLVKPFFDSMSHVGREK